MPRVSRRTRKKRKFNKFQRNDSYKVYEPRANLRQEVRGKTHWCRINPEFEMAQHEKYRGLGKMRVTLQKREKNEWWYF